MDITAKTAMKEIIKEALDMTLQEMGLSQEQYDEFVENFIKNFRLATMIVAGRGGTT